LACKGDMLPSVVCAGKQILPVFRLQNGWANSAQMIDRVYAKPTDHIQVPEL
jgi:hypothetical protein